MTTDAPMGPPNVNDPQRFGPPAPVTDGDVTIWRDVIVGEAPGFRPLTLDLYRPPGDSPVPLIVWIHGGAWLFGSNKVESVPLLPGDINNRILAAGFAVARVTYRLSGEARFPAQLHDVKAAVRWLRHHAAALNVDPTRFGVWGESAGGHLASLVALTGDDPALTGRVGILEGSDAVQSGVIWYGPSNLLSMAAQNHPQGFQDHDSPDAPEGRLVGGPVQSLPTESAAASPVTYASAAAPPLLLIHGAEDRVVPAAQSTELHEALLTAGASTTLEIIPAADHCFVGAGLPPIVTTSLTHFTKTLL
ncbi:alpha/beta hydrolase [Actinoplanes sp. NPDC051851]|uniref:alpha/beta hydrolase n=1 Tax=Actinoplanes sp. NPDC051851 TaxID=3154753 RepID=UPI0034410D99